MTIRTDTTDFSDINCIYDQYTQARGTPKLYKIFCAACDNLAFLYQKDGGGTLVRCYKDRIHWPLLKKTDDLLTCQNCIAVIGIHMIYEPENRPAFRLNQNAYHIEALS